MDTIKQYISYELMDIALYQYMLAFLAILGGFILRKLFIFIM